MDLFAHERIGDIQIVAFKKREYDKDGCLPRAVCYLLCVSLGRWLRKTGNRAYIDNYPKRQLSLFGLGWDLIVNYMNCRLLIPFRLILYS